MSLTQTPPDRLDLAVAWVTEAYEELVAARCELYRELRKRRASGRQPGRCGTPAGYRRHQRAKEHPCIACVEAWTWDASRRAAR